MMNTEIAFGEAYEVVVFILPFLYSSCVCWPSFALFVFIFLFLPPPFSNSIRVYGRGV